MHQVGELRKLPPELIAEILLLLDTSSLVACRQVCHSLRLLIHDDLRLQYKHDLSIASLEGTSTVCGGGMDLVDRLALLRSYRAAWRTFQPRVEKSHKASLSLSWSIRDSVMGKLAANGTANEAFTYSFEHISSPSREAHSVAMSWQFLVKQIPSAHALCPCQNLLAAVRFVGGNAVGSQAYYLYFRTLSGFEHHPAAHLPFLLCHNLITPGDSCTSRVEICGDYVSILFRYRASGTWLRVYNWKTSQLVLLVEDSAIESVTFLTPVHIVAACLRREGRPLASLRVFAIPSRPSASHAPDANAADIPYTGPVLELGYPPMAPNCFPLDHSLYSEPSPEWDTNCDVGLRLPNVPPFRISRRARLLVATLRAMPVMAEGTELETFWILVPCATLEALLSNSSVNPAEARVVQWAQWGPKGTRMFHSKSDSDSLLHAQAAFGMRWVGPARIVSTKGSRPRSELSCKVYDFNSWGFVKPIESHTSPRTPMDDSAKAPVLSTALTAPAVVDSWVFCDPVITHLPGIVHDVILPIGNPVEADEEAAVGLWEDGFIVRQISRPRMLRILSI